MAGQIGRPVQGVETSAAIVFLVLAVATALFFRVSRRVVRVGLLTITVPSTFVLAWLSYQRGPGYMALFCRFYHSAGHCPCPGPVRPQGKRCCKRGFGAL